LSKSESGGILAGVLRHPNLKVVMEMPHPGRLLLGLILAAACLAAVGVATAAQLAAVNHFQCYRVDPGTAWKPVGLVLST
jgi:hypothetical protein